MGVSVYLLIPGERRRPLSAQSSCFAGTEIISRKLIGTPAGIKELIRHARRLRIQAISAIAEEHCLWLARNSQEFAGVCKLLLPPIECLERLECKLEQARLAREAGFNVLPTYVLRDVSDISGVPPESYPLCVRPDVRNAVEPPFKVQCASSASELRHYFRDVWTLRYALIGQPLRVLPNMVVHCTSLDGGKLLHAQAFLADRKFEGLALRIRPMGMPVGMVDMIRRFSATVQLSGAYHFDFLYCPRNGTAYFLEVNPRFGGTTDKVRWLGVDEPANCLYAYGLSSDFSPMQSRVSRGAVTNKRAILKHLLAALRHDAQPWDYPLESRGKAVLHSLADLLFAKDSIFDWKDLRGTLAFYSQGLI